MTTLSFTLYLIICGPTYGCTELLAASNLTHIECLMEGAAAIENGRADKFVCRREDTHV